MLVMPNALSLATRRADRRLAVLDGQLRQQALDHVAALLRHQADRLAALVADEHRLVRHDGRGGDVGALEREAVDPRRVT